MSQNANPFIAINGMFNKSIIRVSTKWTQMNISGKDYSDQVANNYLAKPMYIQTVDAWLYCQSKDNVYSSYKVDSKHTSVLLSSHCSYLLKNMQLCPHKGHIGNPSILVNSDTRDTSLNSKKQLLNVHTSPYSQPPPLSFRWGKGVTKVVCTGYRTLSLLLLNKSVGS